MSELVERDYGADQTICHRYSDCVQNRLTSLRLQGISSKQRIYFHIQEYISIKAITFRVTSCTLHTCFIIKSFLILIALIIERKRFPGLKLFGGLRFVCTTKK